MAKTLNLAVSQNKETEHCHKTGDGSGLPPPDSSSILTGLSDGDKEWISGYYEGLADGQAQRKKSIKEVKRFIKEIGRLLKKMEGIECG